MALNSPKSSGADKEVMQRAWNQAAGNLVRPMLTRTNYQSWSAHVQCNLEGIYLWDAIESDKVERRHDQLAVGAMLRGVPEDMHAMLLNKKLAKEAWESLKTMHLGADRVKETSVDDARVVKKFLRVVLPRYNQVAMAIEMFCDVKTLSIEELVGHLRAAEARFEPMVEQVTDTTGRLLLMEEEWMARNKSRMVNAESSSGGGKGGGKYIKKDQSRGRGVSSGGSKHGHDTRESGGGLTSKGTPRRKGRCQKCGVYGHWGKECLNKKAGKEEHEDAMHHVAADTEAKPALLVAQWDDTDTVPGLATGSEEAAVPDFEPVSPAASIPSAGGASNTPLGTPNSNSGTPLIQWATPPTGQSVDSEGF
ncbi:unnamed protein product [Miscanthus lutarioriparius]|uniref:CCHC-type domain-containing protein n=1 Tax=Miscanthus lutarioriparius TaxID=422564 RepID=A0A811RY28_9POAL|nr:unnamed protein product [Miscanthus lutarioriparius]